MTASPRAGEKAAGGSGRMVLLLGVLTRILVFCTLSPLDADVDHLAVIRYILAHHAIPPSNLGSESWQPPLYYLLAAPFLAIDGNLKILQGFSLLCSVATLLIVYRLLYRQKVVTDAQARLWALALACFLPQFVLYGLFISNDTLAMLLGAATVWAFSEFVERPDNKRVALVAVATGLGVLTKESFLPFVTVVFAAIVFVRMRGRETRRAALASGIIFLILACGVGSYKFIRNYKDFRTPIVDTGNSSLSWVVEQKKSYRGVRSFLDFNFLRLLRSPTVTPETEGSYAITLYGTFWYQYYPDGNIQGTGRAPFKYVGSAIYLLGLAPSGLFLAGLFSMAGKFPRFVRDFKWERDGDRAMLTGYVSVLFLLGEAGLVFAAAAKYHIWSIMHSRLLFPGFYGWLVAFCAGIEVVRERKPRLIPFMAGAQWALVGLFATFLGGESAYQILLAFVPGLNVFLRGISRR